jgi:cytidylate kinase
VGTVKNDPYVVAAFLKAKEEANWVADGANPFITISRQVGAEGEAIALRTSQILSAMNRGAHPWIVVDKDIAERVIEDHHLPKRISSFFTDEQSLSIEEHLEGILGISVPSATMIEKLTQTVIQLAQIGHVIFVGRAAHVITAKFPCAVHVRIMGSFHQRVERVALARGCTVDEAAAEVRRIDHQRHHYVTTQFHSDNDAMENYDMIFNTDRISVEECALLISQLVSSPDFRKENAMRHRELRQRVLGSRG